jgi:methanogenic corrinoid protein MtbC1
MINAEQAQKSLIELILKGERERAGQLLEEFATSTDYRSAMNSMLEPVLRDIGEKWEEENLSLAQGI